MNLVEGIIVSALAIAVFSPLLVKRSIGFTKFLFFALPLIATVIMFGLAGIFASFGECYAEPCSAFFDNAIPNFPLIGIVVISPMLIWAWRIYGTRYMAEMQRSQLRIYAFTVLAVVVATLLAIAMFYLSGLLSYFLR